MPIHFFLQTACMMRQGISAEVVHMQLCSTFDRDRAPPGNKIRYPHSSSLCICKAFRKEHLHCNFLSNLAPVVFLIVPFIPDTVFPMTKCNNTEHRQLLDISLKLVKTNCGIQNAHIIFPGVAVDSSKPFHFFSLFLTHTHTHTFSHTQNICMSLIIFNSILYIMLI